LAPIFSLLVQQTFLQRIDDKLDLFAVKFGIHGQGKEFLGALFRNRERTRSVTEKSISFLQVNGHRIVDRAVNAPSSHFLQNLIAVFHSNRVDVIDVDVSPRSLWPNHPRLVGEEFVVKLGMSAAGGV